MIEIARIDTIKLAGIPVTPPPFRNVPSTATVYLIRIEATDGTIGWGSPPSWADDDLARLVSSVIGPAIIGADALRIEAVRRIALQEARAAGTRRMFIGALSALDIALWDLQGKHLGTPVHQLLGGAQDQVEVYITHGVTYADQAPYELPELVEEAAELVRQGAVFLKTGVARDAVCDPEKDAERIAAIRAAVGDEINLAIDGVRRMTLAEAVRLAHLCEPLRIEFLEEPVIDNDPTTMARLRQQTSIPLAAGSRGMGSVLPLLQGDAVDILQLNTTHDGGFTGGLAVANAAAMFGVALGHGNGGGPHNVAMLAGVPNGGAVEYHYLRWMSYDAVFEGVPAPEGGRIRPPEAAGVGMTPRDGVIDEYRVEVA